MTVIRVLTIIFWTNNYYFCQNVKHNEFAGALRDGGVGDCLGRREGLPGATWGAAWGDVGAAWGDVGGCLGRRGGLLGATWVLNGGDVGGCLGRRCFVLQLQEEPTGDSSSGEERDDGETDDEGTVDEGTVDEETVKEGASVEINALKEENKATRATLMAMKEEHAALVTKLYEVKEENSQLRTTMKAVQTSLKKRKAEIKMFNETFAKVAAVFGAVPVVTSQGEPSSQPASVGVHPSPGVACLAAASAQVPTAKQATTAGGAQDELAGGTVQFPSGGTMYVKWSNQYTISNKVYIFPLPSKCTRVERDGKVEYNPPQGRSRKAFEWNREYRCWWKDAK